MQLKKINRNEIVEHKKRLDKHKKVIEGDIKEVTTQEKTVGNNDTIKEETVKKKTVKKSVAYKKAKRDKQKIISEEAMNNVNKGKAKIAELPEESKVTITKEERAERFKRLNALARDMTKKWNK